FGWPTTFVAVGAAGFVWLALLWAPYHTPEEGKEGASAPPPPVWRLFRTRFVLSFTLSKMFMDPVWYFYTFWFPEYLKNARHFDMAAIGAYAWIPFLVAGSGNILGGLLSGH